MNQVFLIGRLTRDPELKFIPNSGTAIAKFSLAVDRDFKKEGQPEADFFNIVVWGKQAESVANNLNKGRKVAVVGRIENNNYEDKNGVKHFGNNIIANRVEFLDYSSDTPTQNTRPQQAPKKQEPQQESFSGFQSIDDDDIPFA